MSQTAFARVRDLASRARVAARVGTRTGLFRRLSPRGWIAALAAASGKVRDPTQVFRVHALSDPSRVAVASSNLTISFGELDARMNRVAAAMRKRSIGIGSHVLLVLRNRPEFFELQGATTRLGAGSVNVSWRSTPSELRFFATHAGVRLVVFEHDLYETIREAFEGTELTPDRFVVVGGGEGGAMASREAYGGATPYEELLSEPAPQESFGDKLDEHAAVLMYTSGTTGKPKGAVRKFPRDALASALRFIGETPMRCDDHHLVTCPLYHATAMGFATIAHVLGSSVFVMDEFSPERFLEFVERYAITTTALVPTMLHRILALDKAVLARYRTGSLRAIFCGGAPLPAPLAARVMDHFGDILFNFYGATETGLVTLAKPADLRKAGSTIGRAIPGITIRLLDEQGSGVAVGSVGELYARSGMIVEGYYADTDATLASMDAGFFSVGDLARIDASGLYFLEGRKRDLIISGGVNVYPAEVEGVLERHEAIAEAAVVGVVDEEWGERVRAFVVVHPGFEVSEDELRVWCKRSLAGPKVPREFLFLERLPRNPTGKVLKRELRAV